MTDVTGIAKLALLLEETAAATCALPKIADKDAVQLAGSMQIIDRQHAAILHFVLGEYPVPDTFPDGFGRFMNCLGVDRVTNFGWRPLHL